MSNSDGLTTDMTKQCKEKPPLLHLMVGFFLTIYSNRQVRWFTNVLKYEGLCLDLLLCCVQLIYLGGLLFAEGNQREVGEGLGRVERGENAVGMYCMGEEKKSREGLDVTCPLECVVAVCFAAWLVDSINFQPATLT